MNQQSKNIPEVKQQSRSYQDYLKEYLDLGDQEIEQINLIKAKDLVGDYQQQFNFLSDKRLEKITIGIVPDNLWQKGSSPSESHAEEGLILIRQGYYEKEENPDEIAWIVHELAHCQQLLNLKSEKKYQEDMQTFAIEGIGSEFPYPNNKVEAYTFTKQFEFLKQQGKTREQIIEMLQEHYERELDLTFFNRLLDIIYN